MELGPQDSGNLPLSLEERLTHFARVHLVTKREVIEELLLFSLDLLEAEEARPGWSRGVDITEVTLAERAPVTPGGPPALRIPPGDHEGEIDSRHEALGIASQLPEERGSG